MSRSLATQRAARLGPDVPALGSYRPAILWKLTPAGADYLATRQKPTLSAADPSP
jgi:hypothetical protein